MDFYRKALDLPVELELVESNHGIAEKVRITEKGDAPARIQEQH